MTTLSIPKAVAPTTSSGRDHSANGVQRPPKLRVAWVPDRTLEHPEWVAVGIHFGSMGRVSNWWIGDWIEYGTANWGEKYAEASRITRYDVKSLRNIAYVARLVDLSRRRDKLRWSHHAEVAGLEPQEQDKWLDRALPDRLSVSDLRTDLRASQRAPRDDSSEQDPSDDQLRSMICPHCGETIQLDPDAGPSLIAAV